MDESLFWMIFVVGNRFVMDFFFKFIFNLIQYCTFLKKILTTKNLEMFWKSIYRYNSFEFFFGKWQILYQWIGWRAREWDIQYRKKPVEKRKTAPQWRYVYDAGVYRGKGTCCFKIRYNENYLTILIEIPHVDKRHDLESCVKFDLKKNCLRPTATLSTYFLNDPRSCTFFFTFSQYFLLLFSILSSVFKRFLHKHRIYVSAWEEEKSVKHFRQTQNK